MPDHAIVHRAPGTDYAPWMSCRRVVTSSPLEHAIEQHGELRAPELVALDALIAENERRDPHKPVAPGSSMDRRGYHRARYLRKRREVAETDNAGAVEELAR